MGAVVRREIRKRGFFGWVFLLVFVAFNIVMLLWMIGGASVTSETQAVTTSEQAGRAIGGALGMGIILFIWLAGAVILGMFALLTRGRKIIIEEAQ